jgi:hypothetical protein
MPKIRAVFSMRSETDLLNAFGSHRASEAVHGLLIDPLKNSQRGPKVIRPQGTYPFDGMKFDVFRLACS